MLADQLNHELLCPSKNYFKRPPSQNMKAVGSRLDGDVYPRFRLPWLVIDDKCIASKSKNNDGDRINSTAEKITQMYGS